MSSTGISILGKNGSSLEAINSSSNALSVNLAANNAGTLIVSDSTAQTTLGNINSALGGSLTVSDSAAQSSLSSINTEITSVDNKLPAKGQNAKAESVSVALASDMGSLSVSDSASQTSLSTISTQVTAMNGKVPNLGQVGKSASVPVVIASDQGNLSVAMGALSSSATQTHAGVSVANSATSISSAVDLDAVREVSVFGNCTETGTEIEILVSSDDTNYYKKTDISIFSDYSSGDFGKSFKVNARYLKVKYVNDSGGSKTLSSVVSRKL